MTERDRATLRAVVRTLDSLTVSGSGNMSKLLGCLGALEELLAAETEERKETERGGQTNS